MHSHRGFLYYVRPTTCLLVNYFFLKGAEIPLPRGKICVFVFFSLLLMSLISQVIGIL